MALLPKHHVLWLARGHHGHAPHDGVAVVPLLDGQVGCWVGGIVGVDVGVGVGTGSVAVPSIRGIGVAVSVLGIIPIAVASIQGITGTVTAHLDNGRN